MEEERDRLLALAIALHHTGALDADAELSLGSTPTMRVFENAEHGPFRITEIRPGNYVFNDAEQVALGAATLDDCALTVYATVVSKQPDEQGGSHLFLDAGKKVFTSDTGWGTAGYGILLYNPELMKLLPHAELFALSEEHGWVRVPGAATLDVGDRVRVVPNHACVAVNTQDELSRGRRRRGRGYVDRRCARGREVRRARRRWVLRFALALVGVWAFIWFGNDVLRVAESEAPSVSHGTASDGWLEYGKRLPSTGDNFLAHTPASVRCSGAMLYMPGCETPCSKPTACSLTIPIPPTCSMCMEKPAGPPAGASAPTRRIAMVSLLILWCPSLTAKPVVCHSQLRYSICGDTGGVRRRGATR